MKGLELLEKYPLSATLIRAWFLEKMLESLNDASISDEFKRMMREAGIENDKIGTLIDVNPRMLFDVFLENNIQIGINPLLESRNFEGSIYLNFEKIKSIENEVYKELEKEIITICFEELENIL
jgi:hypothetical protein